MKIHANDNRAIVGKNIAAQNTQAMSRAGDRKSVVASLQGEDSIKRESTSFQSLAHEVSISDEGRKLAAANQASAQRVETWEMVSVEPLEDSMYHDFYSDYERASLSRTMRDLENGIRGILQLGSKNPGLAVGSIRVEVIRQLNAYGHHQKALGHTLLGDPYLNSILDRLGALDPKCENPLVNKLRSLVGNTMIGKDNDFLTHEESAGLIKEYRDYLGMKPDTLSNMPKKAGRYFNEKTAAYGFFQEMSRKAKNMEELLSAMLGEDHTGGKKDKKAENPTDLSQLIAEKKTALDDGMKAYKKSLRTLHRIADDKGEGEDGKLSEREQAEEKKRLIPSVTGYDWDRISEQYLKENPELAAIFSDNGVR